MAKCYSCKGEYESQDQEDLDGFGYCSSCFEKQKELRVTLDAKIKPVSTPKKEYRWIPAAVPGGKLYLE